VQRLLAPREGRDHEADAKGRQLIRRLAQTNPGASLVVMGCYATRDPEAISRLPGVVVLTLSRPQ